MDKVLKAKKKALNEKYYELFFQVTKYLQSQNLTKYAFYKLRDKAIEDIYLAQQEGTPVDKVYKRGYELYFQKKVEKLPKMSVLEQISNIIMVFFVMFSILSIFVYIYRFFVKVDTFYSQGIYLYISIDNLRNMLLYGFLGALVATFVQKTDKKRRWIQACGIAGVGVAIMVLLILLSNIVASNLKINMIIIIPVFLALSVGGYFLNDLLAKRKYNGKIEIEE